MFKKLEDLRKHHQLIYSFVIAIAFISIWRGAWNLFDYYIFPSNFVLSAVTTLVIGVIILAITNQKLS